MEVTVKMSPEVAEKLFDIMKERSLDFNSALRICILDTPTEKSGNLISQLLETRKELAETKKQLEQVYDVLARTEKRAVYFGERLRDANKQIKSLQDCIKTQAKSIEYLHNVEDKLERELEELKELKGTVHHWHTRCEEFSLALQKTKEKLKASNDTLNNWRASARADREILIETWDELTATKEHLETWKGTANSHREIQYELRDELKEANEQIRFLNRYLDLQKLPKDYLQYLQDVADGLKDKFIHLREVEDALRKELRVADKLIETRNELLEIIPECPIHGNQCVPHAIAWVKDRLCY